MRKKKFDEMWDIPRLYVSACSNSVQLVPLHPIVISILFHHYKELKECISEIEHMEVNRSPDNISNRKIDWLTIKEEEEEDKKMVGSHNRHTLGDYSVHELLLFIQNESV